MITLATNVVLEDLNRARVRSVSEILDDATVATVVVEVLRPSAGVYASVRLEIGEVTSEKVDVNPTPIGYADRIHKGTIGVPGALTRLKAIWDGAGTRNAKLQATETLGLADGWIGPGLAGTVG